MLASNNKYAQYANTAAQTANRLQLLIMLYDGAIRFIDQAKEQIEKKDLAGKGVNIGKALAIVGEFKSTLDFSVGGDVPKQLEKLYNFVESSLVRANIDNNIELLKNGRRILVTLRSAWVELEAKGVGSDPELNKSGNKSAGSESMLKINV